MTQPFGSLKPEGFQVAVSSLTLGTLYEAILAFSSQDSLETFWPSVCQNTRWLIPSRRVSVLVSEPDSGFEIVGLFEQGKFEKSSDRFTPGDDPMARDLATPNAQWLDDPVDRYQKERDPWIDWLLRDRPDCLFVLPMRVKGKTMGLLVFATGALSAADRAMLNTLGTIYGLHAAMTYTLIRITEERRQMQEQLVMQERMASLGRLVAGLAHEFNTPIGSVVAAADTSTRCINKLNELVSEMEENERIKQDPRLRRASSILLENNEVIARAGNRIAEMVRSLKDFAKLDEADFQSVDIHEGIESSLRIVRHELEGKVDIVKDYGSLPKVYCYPSQLNQVFVSLLVNAAESIEEQGTVTIRTSADDQNVYVTLADTGQGIAQENIGKIFDPGFTTKGGLGVGTGLGLSICYNIMKKHRGSVSVKSEVGHGTEFTLTLPRQHDAG